MKALRVVLFIFCAICSVKNKQLPASNLDLAIKPLTVVSHVINGMAIQSQLSLHPQEAVNITAELLNVPTDSIWKVSALDVESAKDSFKRAGDQFLEKATGVQSGDLDALKSGMEVLRTFWEGDLKNSVPQDPTAPLQQPVDTVEARTILKTDDCEKFATNLALYDTTTTPDKAKKLSTLLESKTLLGYVLFDMMSLINEYENKFKPLLELSTMPEKVGTITDLVTNYQSFIQNKTVITALKADIAALFAGYTQIADLSSTYSYLSPMITKANKTLLATSDIPIGHPKQFTVGFAEGISDMAKIKDDVKEFPRIAGAEGKTIDVKDFAAFIDFHSKVTSMSSVWKDVTTDSKAKMDFVELRNLASEVYNEYRKFESQEIGKSVKTPNTCLADLKEPTTASSFDDFQELVTFANEVKTRVDRLTAIVGKNGTIRKADKYTENFSAVVKLKNTVKVLNSQSDDTKVTDAWNAVLAIPELKSLPAFIRSYATSLKAEKDDSVFEYINTFTKWDTAKNMLQSIEGTKLSTVLTCLNNQKADLVYENMQKVDSYGKKITEANSKLKTADAYFQTILDAQKMIVSLTTTATATTSKPPAGRRRRRRASPGSRLNSLPNLERVNSELGRAVESLRQLKNIQLKEGKILAISGTTAQVDQIIAGIPGAQNAWKKDTKKTLKEIVTKTKSMADLLPKHNMELLTSFEAVFAEASNIASTRIDAKLFDNPISQTLATNPDPKVKTMAGNFKECSELDLDFAAHRANFVAASYVLEPIQQFFDDLFGITRATPAPAAQGSDGSDNTLLFIGLGAVGGLALLGGAGYGFVYMKKREKEKKKQAINEELYKEKEKWWAYQPSLRYGPYDDNSNLAKLAKEDDMIEIQRLLQIRMVNFYLEGKPALHHAVLAKNPKVIKLFLQNGADPKLKDVAGKTALEICDTFKTHENYEKITKMLQKYETKEVMETMYAIKQEEKKFVFSPADNPLAEQFYKKFPTTKPDPAKFYSTHVVVITGEDRIVYLDGEGIDLMLAMSNIINPRLLMSTEWVEACLKDEKLFEKDYENRITTIMLNGKEQKIDKLKVALNRRDFNILQGVHVAYLTANDAPTNANCFGPIFDALGATIHFSWKPLAKETPTFPAPIVQKHIKPMVFLIGFMEENAMAGQLAIFSMTYEKVMEKAEVSPIKKFFEWCIVSAGKKNNEEKVPQVELANVFAHTN